MPSRTRSDSWKRASVLACLLLVVGCFLRTEKDRYIERVGLTKNTMTLASNSWENVKTGLGLRSRELRPKRDQRRKQLLPSIQNGFSWSELGDALAAEALATALQKPVETVAHDAWGNRLEFRVVDDFLAIRSAGADGQFEGDFYEKSEFEWPSGGDLVVVAGYTVTEPKDYWD